jgi:hypothetical protein
LSLQSGNEQRSRRPTTGAGARPQRSRLEEPAAGGARGRPSAGGIRRRGLELTRCPPATRARARRSELTADRLPLPNLSLSNPVRGWKRP